MSWPFNFAGKREKSRGEEQAFDELFRENFAPLTIFAIKMIRDRDAAEDIVQHCFLQVWEKHSQLHHVWNMEAYLYGAVRNQCLKFLQQLKRLSHKAPELSVPPIDTLIVMAETAKALHRSLDLLPGNMPEILRLHFMEGKTCKEISQILGILPESVARQKLRAIQLLRKTKISFS